MRVEVPSGEATEIPFTAHIQQEMGPLVKFDYPINDSVLTISQIRGARPSPDGARIVFSALDRLWTAPLPDPAGTQTEGYPSHPPTRAASPRRPMWNTARRGRRTAATSHT